MNPLVIEDLGYGINMPLARHIAQRKELSFAEGRQHIKSLLAVVHTLVEALEGYSLSQTLSRVKQACLQTLEDLPGYTVESFRKVLGAVTRLHTVLVAAAPTQAPAE